MSNRTLIEINHDFAGDIDRGREKLLAALLDHLRSIDYGKVPGDLFPGVRVLAVRHHSEPGSFRWGYYAKDEV